MTKATAMYTIVPVSLPPHVVKLNPSFKKYIQMFRWNMFQKTTIVNAYASKICKHIQPKTRMILVINHALNLLISS